MSDDEDYPGGWFGHSWGAPICDQAEHLPTPIGERCLDCEEVFKGGDQGLTFPGVHDGAVELRSMHIGCFLKMIGTDC